MKAWPTRRVKTVLDDLRKQGQEAKEAAQRVARLTEERLAEMAATNQKQLVEQREEYQRQQKRHEDAELHLREHTNCRFS